MWCLLISVLKVSMTFTVNSYWCKVCSYWRLPDIDSIYWVCSWTIWIALALQKSKSVERIPIDGGNDGEWKDSEEIAPDMQSLAYGASTEDMFFDALWWCLQVYSFTKNLGFICGFSNCISYDVWGLLVCFALESEFFFYKWIFWGMDVRNSPRLYVYMFACSNNLLHHFSWLGDICKSMDGVPEHVLVTILHCPDILGFCTLFCTGSHQECCWCNLSTEALGWKRLMFPVRTIGLFSK